jgi:hypothetical protein
MNSGPRVGTLVVAALCLGCGLAPARAQAPRPASAPRTYECAAGARCSVYCLVDGEKQFQTGSPKEIIVTPLARNNYLVELTEQTGQTQFVYLAGTKVVCIFQGVTKKGGE